MWDHKYLIAFICMGGKSSSLVALGACRGRGRREKALKESIAEDGLGERSFKSEEQVAVGEKSEAGRSSHLQVDRVERGRRSLGL